MSVALGIPVGLVPDNGAAKFGGVDAYLVEASGVDPEFDEREAVVLGEYRPVCHGGEALAADWLIDRARFRLGCAVQDGEIDFADILMRFELAAESEIGTMGLCKHHDTACFEIQTMDNARTFNGADSLHLREAFDKLIGHGTFGVSVCRMDDHTGGFVHNHYVVIIVEYLYRHVPVLYHVFPIRTLALSQSFPSFTVIRTASQNRVLQYVGRSAEVRCGSTHCFWEPSLHAAFVGAPCQRGFARATQAWRRLMRTECHAAFAAPCGHFASLVRSIAAQSARLPSEAELLRRMGFP